MSGQLQLRRGTTAQNNAFTGAVGELTYNTDDGGLISHNGVTAGGYPGGGYLYAPGAVVTNVQAKLQETVSVKDYGATGTGADDTVAIQLAITSNPGKTIFFPAGTYVITATLTISANNTQLVGAGSNCTYIRNDSAGLDAVRIFSVATASASDFVNGCGVSQIYIFRTVAATTGAGIRVRQVNGGIFKDFIVSNCPEGVVVEGGQFNTFDTFKLFANGAVFDLNLVETSALMTFKEATLSGGLFQPCFTCTVSNFFTAGSKKVYSVFLIANVDGLQMSSGYAAGGRWTLFHAKGLRDGGYIAGVTATGIYFDAVGNVTGSNNCVYIASDAFSTFAIYDVSFSNCVFGNTVAGAILGRRSVVTLKCIGCTFVNINTWSIDVEGDSNVSSLNLVGNQINGTGLLASGAGAVIGKNLLSFAYTGNTVRIDSGAGATLLLTGTIRSASIVGNTNQANTADLSYSGAILAGRLVISGNSGSDTNPNTTFSGERVGNLAVTDANTLDWYEENSFTPTFSFGLAAVGLTYTTQTGRFTRIGNRVHFNAILTLSAKGSSTGTARLASLPYANGSGFQAAVSFRASSLQSSVGDTALSAVVQTSSTGVEFYKMASGSGVLLVDTDITDTSTFIVAGTYQV